MDSQPGLKIWGMLTEEAFGRFPVVVSLAHPQPAQRLDDIVVAVPNSANSMAASSLPAASWDRR